MLVSAALLCAGPLACGAAALVAGAAFYAFMLSKMYEEYLEDYVYKLMAKIFARVRRIFRSKKPNKETESEPPKASTSREQLNDDSNRQTNGKTVNDSKDNVASEKNKCECDTTSSEPNNDNNKVNDESGEKPCDESEDKHAEVDEDLSSLNFHMMMFSMWLAVTLVNVPALLTWARNFSYSMVLKPDTSYHTGLVMSACSTCVWQMNLPRRNLRHYDSVAALLFTMAVFLLALGPLSLTIVNYGVTFMFAVITLQQVFDKEETVPSIDKNKNEEKTPTNEQNREDNAENRNCDDDDEFKKFLERETVRGPDLKLDDCVVCTSSKMYRIFKNMKDKFSATENL